MRWSRPVLTATRDLSRRAPVAKALGASEGKIRLAAEGRFEVDHGNRARGFFHALDGHRFEDVHRVPG
jgi:hypothetical protein